VALETAEIAHGLNLQLRRTSADPARADRLAWQRLSACAARPGCPKNVEVALRAAPERTSATTISPSKPISTAALTGCTPKQLDGAVCSRQFTRYYWSR